MSMVEVENRGMDDNFFHFLCKRWESSPIHESLDISLNSLGQGAAGLKMRAGQEFTTVRGRLHGGITTTLADTAMGWAILTLGRSCVTIDIYMSFFTPCFGEDELIAEANVIQSGKRTVVAEATIFNSKGELVAKSMGTFSLKKGNIQVES